MPLDYVLSGIVLIMISRRIILYDVTDTAIETISSNGKTGFASFDKNFHYLGSNHIAKDIYPELAKLKVDDSVPQKSELNDELIVNICRYVVEPKKNSFFKNSGRQIFQVAINNLFDGRTNRGYILYMQDDTRNQKYISLLNKFKERLKDEVAEKTENIVKMHDNLILSMATMVESRDNSTGGHIRRTSDVVKVLIDEIRKDEANADGRKNIRFLFGKEGLTDEFCKNMIQAAPMHDLGKIAVDDAVLRKPGKFTPEEYAEMKKHAAEGARIVDQILDGTENEAFHKVAVNVAHYHHERWDGSGYPEGLKGEEIPIEARIMAIADVYDALVSKRVYKDKFSFDDADRIMMESMGKHFDKRLERYYLSAKPRLEEYYRSMGD